MRIIVVDGKHRNFDTDFHKLGIWQSPYTDKWYIIESREDAIAEGEYGDDRGYVYELRDATKEEIAAELSKPRMSMADFDNILDAWDKR